jgi:hypothetical protein
MNAVSLANLKRLLDPRDRIAEGSRIFDRVTVDGALDPCVATINFGDEVLRMYVTQTGKFTVGSSQAPMNRDALAAVARAHSLVVKAGLTDSRDP